MHVHALYGLGMRTTIELSDRIRAELLRVAARRGLKGFSQIVEEAISQYLSTLKRKDRDLKKALKFKGSLSSSEADEILRSASELRSKWRI